MAKKAASKVDKPGRRRHAVRRRAAAPRDPPHAVDTTPESEFDDLAPLPPGWGDGADASVPTVVGVGASAGGLEAFTQLLEPVPSDARLAFVLVQHLAPQHDSSLVTLLGAKTRLPVVQVRDGMAIEAGHVYVIPPNAQMGVERGVLRLSPRTAERTPFAPIDYFFQTLAAWAHNRAIGVILSGTGADGSLGIRDIKEAGGIVIAQAPATSTHDGMPRAAIATGMVDLVLPPGEIATHLTHIQQHPYVAPMPPAAASVPAMEPTEQQMREMYALLRRISGVDFGQYKMPTVRRRLFRRMALRRVTSVDEYLQLVRADAQELQTLYRDLLIYVTRFFRDPESFAALSAEVLPEIFQSGTEDPVRIWVPGCATGEEAYSVAICVSEVADRHAAGSRVQIFGTDVSEAAIEHARTGVYPASIASNVSPERLRRFFVPSDGGFKVAKGLRDMCIFARHDLTRDPSFSRLDLLVCRNVMIYLESAQQRRLMSVFHYALKPRGFLMLGVAETPGRQPLFATVNKRWRIYRKVPDETVMPAEFGRERVSPAVLPPARQSRPITAQRQSAQDETSRVLLQKYGPPGVIVDEQLHVVQFRGSTGHVLEAPSGEPNLNLLKHAREGLLFPLRGAIQTARRTKRAVRKENVSVRSDGRWKRINLEVVPLAFGSNGHLLVIFEDADTRPGARQRRAPKTTRRSARQRSEDRVEAMASELAASRGYLQSIIQELEAANDELQSANEEILSSNEELQSTNEELDTAKEELQSTNEELNTLNEELHSRNEELTRVNSDLVNLLATVDLTILIVGNDMRIRRFTPLAERVLNLIPGDIGRPLGQINTNLMIDSLETIVTRTIDTMQPQELDVHDRSGRWYSLRVRPYRTIDNRIDGAVLTLADIGLVRDSRQQVDRLRREALELVNASRDPMVIVDASQAVRLSNAAFSRLSGAASDLIVGRPVAAILAARCDSAALQDVIAKVQQGGEPIDAVRVESPSGAAAGTGLLVSVRPVSFEENGTLVIAREAEHANR